MGQFRFEELDGSDGRGNRLTRTVEVPDGKWVVSTGSSWFSEGSYGEDDDEGWSESERTDLVIVGPAPAQHVRERSSCSAPYNGSTYSSSGSSFSTYVGDEPFGIIATTVANGQAAGGAYFHCARQVHKGELGRRPEIARPQFARLSRNYDDEYLAWRSEQGHPPVSRRDQRRGHVGWARLTDVARIVRMSPEEVVSRHFLFTHAEHPMLDVLFRERREDIHCQVLPYDAVERFSSSDVGQRLFGRLDFAHAWIRQGFALTVLYLRHFGHVPASRAETEPESVRIAV